MHEFTAMHTISQRPRLYPLTSLRFFAALLIFILHCNNHSLWPESFFFGLDYSKAVCFFFVLSGFVLSYTYHGKSINIRYFYRDRLARIWPATICSTLFVLAILPSSLYLPNSSDASFFPFVLITNIFLLQSLIPLPIFFFGINAVCWSISVEAFFYLVFPWFNSLNERLLALICCFSILSLSALSLIISNSQLPSYSPLNSNTVVWQGLIYINPISRLPEFLIGMISAKLYLYFSASRPNKSFIASFPKVKIPPFFTESITVFVLLLLGFRSPFSFLPVPSQLFFNQIFSAICFSLVIYIVSKSDSLLSSFLSFPPLVFLGEISFGLYLFHQPLLISSAQASGLTLSNFQLLPKSSGHLLFVSIFLASLSYFFLEKPIVKFIKSRL